MSTFTMLTYGDINRLAGTELLKYAHDATAAYDAAEATITKIVAENLDLAGKLADMGERLRSYELAETIADETRAKRHFDGQGDE